MHILRIEHPVPNFDAWKKAYDSDPMGRAQSGVRRHRVFRAVDDPHLVMIDLEFDGLKEAENMLAGLRELWRGVDVMHNPRARIVEMVESEELAGRAER